MARYLFSNGTVIDCTGDGPKERASVLVEDNKIAKIGGAAEVEAAAKKGGAFETIDASGMTIMPGMVDCHVHPSYGDILSFEELDFYPGVEYRTLRATVDIKKVLRAGVTSIATPGGTWNINVALRNAVNSGLIEGPRMAAGGHYISTYNSIGSPWPTHLDHPKSSFGVLCNTRDEMIVQARKEIKEGVDIVKVAGDGDALTADGTLLGSISYDDLKAIADVTHMMGKACTIHARSGRAAADAARAGFDWVIHASFLNDEQLGVFEKLRTPINPTLSLLANSIDWADELGIPSRVTDYYKMELEAASKVLTKAHKAGIMMMAGTDSGQGSVPYGEWHAREMELMMTYLGMSSMEALLAGTKNAAFAMGNVDVGTLKVGGFADILLVDGNPLADIQVLQNKALLKVIMKDGAIVDTKTPLPKPTQYPWEKPLVAWSRLATQDYIRESAKTKPKWMQKRPQAAE
ncbi:MAG: amidohydrolase family protein [Rhodospirillaceae bacterium]|nr:amidohydrolase family protein [Rhodospirillaceae bacterium]